MKDLTLLEVDKLDAKMAEFSSLAKSKTSTILDTNESQGKIGDDENSFENMNFEKLWEFLSHIWLERDKEMRSIENNSEMKTLDGLDTIDEPQVRTLSMGIVNKLFETIKELRDQAKSIVTKEGVKATTVSMVENLYWGSDKTDLINKVKVMPKQTDKKVMIDALLKKQPLGEFDPKTLSEVISKHYIDKYKADSVSKFGATLTTLDLDFREILKWFPGGPELKQLISSITSFIHSKLDKKILHDAEEVFSSLSKHTKQFNSLVASPQQIDGYLPSEIVYPEGVLQPDKGHIVRGLFTQGYSELFSLDFDNIVTKSKENKKTALPRFWNQKGGKIVLPPKLNHCLAIDTFLKNNIKPVLSTIFYKLGHTFNFHSKVSSLYQTFLNFIDTAFTTCKPEGEPSFEELCYHQVSLDCFHSSFMSLGADLLSVTCFDKFFKAKSHVESRLVEHAIKHIWSGVEIAFFDQNWIDFHRFSRVKKATNTRESIECEGIYYSWLCLKSYLRTVCRIYKQYSVDLMLAFPTVLAIKDAFIRKLYDLFCDSPVSVQRAEMYCRDLKLAVNIAEHVYSFAHIVKKGEEPSHFASSIKVCVGKVGFSDPLQLYHLIQQIVQTKNHLKVLYRVLTISGKELETEVMQLNEQLLKNRKIVSSYPLIFRRADLIIRNLKNEFELKQSQTKDIEHSNSLNNGNDSSRKLEQNASSILIRHRLTESADSINVSSVEYFAQDLVEKQMSYYVESEAIQDLQDEWLIRINSYLTELSEGSQTLLEEFTQICQIGDREVSVNPEEMKQVDYIKQKDFFLRRPELLDKDSDLKSHQLAAKNTIKLLI